MRAVHGSAAPLRHAIAEGQGRASILGARIFSLGARMFRDDAASASGVTPSRLNRLYDVWRCVRCARVRAALRAAAERPSAPFVRTALLAAAERCAALRREAARFA
jgi:hypothetical protein